MYIAIGPTTEEYENLQHHVAIHHNSDELNLEQVMEIFKGMLQAYGYVLPDDNDA